MGISQILNQLIIPMILINYLKKRGKHSPFQLCQRLFYIIIKLACN
jgi:hypothetical protein